MRTVRTVRNVHQRVVAAPADTVGALLDRLSAADDPLFPAPAWSSMRLDRPLGVGADGGHGPVRYRVTEYVPGRSVRFGFPGPGGAGERGFHRLDVEPVGPDRCRVVHTLEQSQGAGKFAVWATVVRPVHDTVVEELLDNVERAALGSLAGPRPVRRSAWVRLLHRLTWPRPEAAAIPPGARLVREAFEGRTDFADAWRMSLEPGMDRDPRAWRDVLPFPVLGAGEHELMLGEDASHLDFRASVLIDAAGTSVTLSTVVRIHNARGRLYFAVIRHLHPYMARRMLRRTHRRLALAAPPAGERNRLPAATATATPPAPAESASWRRRTPPAPPPRPGRARDTD
ncbi:DUF2867 domain-containing protein [Streptomyces vilmorinianum]|uniref:DUF2867 domain-containing protein n=1 Tax=Streptomyces vilmorinianum TaxID=3051092 RepID=UPI0010FBB11D|nr:DUF2867 domain-containing protein [Streptomyces vilmorinianum]